MENLVKETSKKNIFTLVGIKKYKLSIAIGIFLVVLISLSSYMQGDNLRLTINDVTPLNNEWSLISSDTVSEAINLPYIAEVPRNEVISIKRDLPIAFRYPMSIRIRSSMQHIIVILDERTIFDNKTFQNQGIFNEPQVSAWYVINLPEGSDGGQLEMQISSDVHMMSGRVNEVYYGQKSDLISELITHQPLVIAFAFFLLVIGCLTGIVSVSIRLDRIKRLNYLSLFTFSIGIWLISELDIMQLITGNNYIVGGISYIMLPVALIGFLLLIKEVALEKYSKIINNLVLLSGVYLIISVLLQLIVNLHFVDQFLFFNLVVLISSMLIVALLLYETLWYQNVVAKKYLYIIAIVLVTVVIEVVKFFTGNFMDISYIGSVGIAIFLMLLMIDTLKYVKGAIQKEGQTLYLEEIAYTDALTGGPNRSAFEKDVDVLLTAKDKTQFRLITFDLNNLKLINDEYGHNCGDQALNDFYQSLKKAYDTTSKCYRVGGDEFMVIQRTVSEDDFIKAQVTLMRCMNKIESERDYMFRCAHGNGIYDYEQSFGDFKHEVDMRMYRMKKIEKMAHYNKSPDYITTE